MLVSMDGDVDARAGRDEKGRSSARLFHRYLWAPALEMA